MSADTQILITLREYCRALEQRAEILSASEYADVEHYQRDLARLDALKVELARRQSVLRAWARGEQPVMAALAQVEQEDYQGARQAWNMRNLKHYTISAVSSQLFVNVLALNGATAAATYQNTQTQQGNAYTQSPNNSSAPTGGVQP